VVQQVQCVAVVGPQVPQHGRPPGQPGRQPAGCPRLGQQRRERVLGGGDVAGHAVRVGG
jgi:hypothetical protein